MTRPRREAELPSLYAMVHSGLEEVAAEEIEHELGGEIKRSGAGVVVFRVEDVGRHVLKLRTTEDVLLYAWGTDALSYRAHDLDSIRRWTDKAHWTRLLQVHHAVRPKPGGKPTYRFVVQMTGEHGYRRADAYKALARGMEGKLPASWRAATENAAVEVWLTIHGAMAVCGLRLSDRTMRHRTYKVEHLPASLRPTVAAAMVRLAGLRAGQMVLDPMCGAGTLLAEALLYARGHRQEGAAMPLTAEGGDIDPSHVRAAAANLSRFGEVRPQTWDARQLPIDDRSIDCILCNPPFGKQLGSPEEIGPLYRQVVREMNRVLRPAGRAVLIVSDVSALQESVGAVGWKQERRVNLRVLGQRASICVYRSRQRRDSEP
jgi:tRNA (guanine6-N2)-methyltransferase